MFLFLMSIILLNFIVLFILLLKIFMPDLMVNPMGLFFNTVSVLIYISEFNMSKIFKAILKQGSKSDSVVVEASSWESVLYILLGRLRGLMSYLLVLFLLVLMLMLVLLLILFPILS